MSGFNFEGTADGKGNDDQILVHFNGAKGYEYLVFCIRKKDEKVWGKVVELSFEDTKKFIKALKESGI